MFVMVQIWLTLYKKKLNYDASYAEFKNMTLELEHVIQTLNYNLTTIKIEKVLNRMGFPLNWSELAKIERTLENDKK